MSDSGVKSSKPETPAVTEVHRAPEAQGASIRHFRLDVLDGTVTKRSCESASERFTIGSHARNDLVIDDPTVSRFHCEIRLEQSRAWAVDLESRNGTVVDGVLVRAAQLRAGSILQLGRRSVRFQPIDQRSALLLSERTELEGLVGRSIAMRACFAVLERAAESDATLLIDGETGTGKSRAARAVHALGRRAKRPFFSLDCGAIPATLLESVLFGHRRGAFTGATEDRVGIFEDAEGGTVFLDEVGEVPLELQSKLLKTLEDREVRRLGTNTYRPLDVRVIAATNRDLRAEVNAGRFRADLFYRLAVVRITIPPLWQRPDDIPVIAERLLDGLGANAESSAALRTPEFIARLASAAWPGNVRELRNHLERCLVLRDALSPAAEAEPTSGPTTASGPHVDPTMTYSAARKLALDAFERAYLGALLDLHGNNVPRAAEAAEIDRAYMYKLLRRHRRAGA